MKLLLSIGLSALLAGCAPYWIRTHAPVPVVAIVEVEQPCSHDWIACANYHQGVIELRKGLPPEQRECAIKHEHKHFAGYSHDIEWVNHRVDCG